MAAGAHCVVYAEEGSGIDTTTAEAIADEFDTVIYDLIRTNFANESDVDSDGRLALLLLDIVDGYSGSGGYVAGYFSPVQLFSRSTYSYSNERDMLFLDTNPATPGSSSFFRTVTHEMQHLVNFANTYLVDETQQDLWINEGLSSGSEFLYAGEQVATRIAYYNADPYSTITYGNNFFVWNGDWESQGYQLENYATVYLFFQWLQIHASNGTGIYKDILLSSERDYQTVVDAATLRISSGLDTWQSLLGTWLQANLLGSPAGLQGYAGEVALTPHVLDAGGTSPLFLSPGEGLYVLTDGGSYAYPGGSGTDIVYQGVDAGTGEIDSTGPSYVGDGIIAFNGNNDYGGDDEYAYLPSVTLPMLTSSLFTPADAAASLLAAGLPESYPVDVTFGPDGGFAPDAPPPAVGPRPPRPLLDRQR